MTAVHQPSLKSDCNIAIIGGGLVGLSLACALADSGWSVVVLEEVPHQSADQPSFDQRTVALTYRSKIILQSIGVWPMMAASDIHSIDQIVVTNRGYFGATRLSAAMVEPPALGYVIAVRALGEALLQRISDASRVKILTPASVNGCTVTEKGCQLTYSSEGNFHRLDCSLAVIADGGRSALMNQIGKPTLNIIYPEEVLVSVVRADKANANTAHERFTRCGPLALLPLDDDSYALAWTLEKFQLKHTLQLNEREFLDQLQDQFGWAAGRFQECGQRKAYAVNLRYYRKPYRERIVAIGNAAHCVHPVAGQGFNLGLRDIASLARLLSVTKTKQGDPGDLMLLRKYGRQRSLDTLSVLGFTHGLIRLFQSQAPAIGPLRGLGLAGLGMFPRIRRQILWRSMGMHQR